MPGNLTLSEKQRIFTCNLAKLIKFAFANGYELAFGEVQRPEEMQKIYYESGRSKTMDSRHLKKLAADFTIWKNGKMLFAPGITEQEYHADIIAARQLGDLWILLHHDNVWGGDWNRNHIDDETFRDPYHFEMKP